jgi:predicted RNA binding protein with dsRBD fold (UPF0201 family)
MKYSCQDCKERTPGCHSTCEKHKADLEELERLKEKIYKERLVDSYQYSFRNHIRTKEAICKLKKERYYTKD